MSYTPGVWHAVRMDGEWMIRTVYHDQQQRRCTAFPATCRAGGQDNEANAKLIAAAPDLLHALKRILDIYDRPAVGDIARAAIAEMEDV